VLVQPGPSDLGQPVFVVQDDGDLVEVEAEQGLQLPDAGHPGQVVVGVAARPAGRALAGGEQADLLVVAERAFGDAGPGRRGAYPEKRPGIRWRFVDRLG
jgi:hypothetical protein